jgi:hypothetical protein
MDHVPRGERARAGRLCAARLTATECAALFEDRRAARPVDRSVDAAAAEQARVRRVDDRVDVLAR